MILVVIVNAQIIVILVVITWTLLMSEHEKLSRDYPFWLRLVARRGEKCFISQVWDGSFHLIHAKEQNLR